MAELVGSRDIDEIAVTSGPWNCGDLKLTQSGLVGINLSMRPLATGETAPLQYRGQVKVTASVSHTAGADVYINVTTQATQNTVTGGFTLAGKARNTVSVGQILLLDLNP